MARKTDPPEDLDAILRQDVLIERALRKAARQAIKEHKEEGRPLVMSRDGKVVWMKAEELEAEIAARGETNQPPEVTMEPKSEHEPEAEVMSADDVWNDAQRLAQVLHRQASQSGHFVTLRIPLSTYLSALDDLSREDLMILRERIEDRLAS